MERRSCLLFSTRRSMKEKVSSLKGNQKIMLEAANKISILYQELLEREKKKKSS